MSDLPNEKYYNPTFTFLFENRLVYFRDGEMHDVPNHGDKSADRYGFIVDAGTRYEKFYPVEKGQDINEILELETE